MCDFEYSDAQIPRIFPIWPGLRSVLACSLKLVLDKRLIWEDTRDLSWVFKAGEEVYGERYWLIFMGAVGDGDFWLFDWRIAQEMCELKCVVRCRRNVMG